MQRIPPDHTNPLPFWILAVMSIAIGIMVGFVSKGG